MVFLGVFAGRQKDKSGEGSKDPGEREDNIVLYTTESSEPNIVLGF